MSSLQSINLVNVVLLLEARQGATTQGPATYFLADLTRAPLSMPHLLRS
jgi:hypothetical protein